MARRCRWIQTWLLVTAVIWLLLYVFAPGWRTGRYGEVFGTLSTARAIHHVVYEYAQMFGVDALRDEERVRRHVEQTLAIPIEDRFGTPMVLQFRSSMTSPDDLIGGMQVVSYGRDGTPSVDDIIYDGIKRPYYLTPIKNGVYWARYRQYSGGILWSALGTALLTAVLWIACRRYRSWFAGLVLFTGILVLAGGWTWDGLLWSRSLHKSPGFLIASLATVIAAAAITCMIRTPPRAWTSRTSCVATTSTRSTG